MKYESVELTINSKDYKQVKTLAKENGVTVNQLISDTLIIYLHKQLFENPEKWEQLRKEFKASRSKKNTLEIVRKVFKESI